MSRSFSSDFKISSLSFSGIAAFTLDTGGDPRETERADFEVAGKGARHALPDGGGVAWRSEADQARAGEFAHQGRQRLRDCGGFGGGRAEGSPAGGGGFAGAGVGCGLGGGGP